MQLRIKQRVFAWGDTYDVYDESGEARYYVKSELFSFGHQIHVYDKLDGSEVGSIHQKLLTFFPEFRIVVGGNTVGSVKKKLSFFTPQYTVDYRNWDVQGNLYGWDYSVFHNGFEVMSIHRQWLTWGDTYILDFKNAADAVPGLLLVIAIDAANCDDD